MIVTHKASKQKFIVASIVKVPGQKNLYKLEDSLGETCLVNEDTINKFFIKSNESSKPVDYFKELDNIKNKVLERVDKINQAIRWLEARKNGLDSSTPEYEKLEQDEEKYKQDLKYFQKVLENVKDKIVDFTSLQSRVSLERQIDLQELYSAIGVSPEKLEQENVQLIKEETPTETKEEVSVEEKPLEETPSSEELK